jgi:hypothetical protein
VGEKIEQARSGACIPNKEYLTDTIPVGLLLLLGCRNLHIILVLVHQHKKWSDQYFGVGHFIPNRGSYTI